MNKYIAPWIVITWAVVEIVLLAYVAVQHGIGSAVGLGCALFFAYQAGIASSIVKKEIRNAIGD